MPPTARPPEPRSAPPSRARRALRDPAFPVALAIAALLLFCWPFVRAPPLRLAEAWAHLTGAWALAIGALWWSSRALGGGDG